MQPTESVPAVERAFAILEALDRSRNGLSMAELSRRLSIPRSSAHALTVTLERCGYVTRDVSQRKCRISNKAYMLGRESIHAESIAAAALLPMQRLSSKTMLTSHLAMLEHNQAAYIQKAQAPSMFNVDTFVGKRTNLHCTAVGKVLLSYAPDDVRSSLLARGNYARYTSNTITTARMLREELDRVSTRGFAFDNEEEELGICCLAVPVFRAGGEVVAALSLSGAAQQFDRSALAERIHTLRHTSMLVGTQLQTGRSQ
ncbi:MAG: IclR family transcriptional regulator [Terriglobus sp.]